MATLEQIIDEARSLSSAEKRKLRQILDLELEQAKAQARAQPTHGQNGDDGTRERRLEWLKSHREEYAGQYVALAGDVLVGHGPTIREAHEQAKQKGVEDPFLVRLTSESEVLFAGW
ncbi:MAG: DUF5678 domain-containing protein [Acidobacteriota bacterium]